MLKSPVVGAEFCNPNVRFISSIMDATEITEGVFEVSGNLVPAQVQD